jgi:hypothetical protein
MEILTHETEIDVTHKLNHYELKAWMKHLNHIQQEINSLEKMCSLDVDGELENKFVLQQLQEKRIENTVLLESLENYNIIKPNDISCEDFQCDLDIISDHEKHRNNYLTYLSHYRKLKNKIYKLLNGKSFTTNNRDLKYG